MSTNKDLQAGALNAWTPVQQAALYHTYLAEQHEKDVLAEAKADKEKEKEKAGKEKIRPEKVEAGKIIDDLASPALVPPRLLAHSAQHHMGPVADRTRRELIY